MKSNIYLVCALFSLYASCQQPANKTRYVKEFGWTISIPDGFESVSGEDLEKMQNRGAAAIQKATGEEVENHAKVLFLFRKGARNYLDAKYQPYDIEKDGNYDETSKQVEHMIYQTFASQMPNAKLDSSTTAEAIGGLQFRKFIVQATMPGMKMTILFYSRLFGKKEFSVNIIYTDENNGHLLKEALAHSTFKATKE